VALCGLDDRGVLAPGYEADVNIVDYERLRLCAPRLNYDLPAGGRRLIQRAEGYIATICSGAVSKEDGQPTGAMPLRTPRLDSFERPLPQAGPSGPTGNGPPQQMLASSTSQCSELRLVGISWRPPVRSLRLSAPKIMIHQ